MNKRIEIIEPSKKIFDLSNRIQDKIKKILPKSKTRLIGSFAIPICGKKEIDILVEVENVKESSKILSKNGFKQGPLIKRESFMTCLEGDIDCDLHVLPHGDDHIKKVYDKTIDYFKKNENKRKEFDELKRSLKGSSPEEYKRKKGEFLGRTVFADQLKEKRNITITGPRSVGKSTISKLLAERLGKKYISSDELGEIATKKFGGLDKAIKTEEIAKIIPTKGYSLIEGIYKKEKNFVFDLSGGSFCSSKFKEASSKVRKIAKKESVVVGLLPSKNILISGLFLYKREIRREHFKDSNNMYRLYKTIKSYSKFPRTLKKESDFIVYTKGKSPN